MSDVAIRVENLSKQYRIGGPQARYNTLRESLAGAAQAPIRRAGRLLRGEAATDHQETIWALKDVSFEVKHGEVLGIIGRNGAGKSTLLKILSRITAPTEGTVDLYGRVGSLLEVGTGFHPELTGRENIFLNGAILGMKRAEIDQKFDEIVAFAELEKFLDTPVKHYSSGMYVRLAFAVAAHLDPEILMVDEVLAVGDVAFQKKCLGKMGEVAGEGRTVLFVSHNLGAIASLCSQALLLDCGLLTESGTVPQVVDKYIVEAADAASTSHLANRIDRQGDGRIKFVGFHLEDLHARHVHALRSGQESRFVLAYVCRNGYGEQNVVVSLAVKDRLGTSVLHHRTNFTHQNFTQVPSKGYFVFRVPKLPLAPGTYTVNLFVGISEKPCDMIEDAATLTIEAGDFFGTGHQGQPSFCPVLVEGDWRLSTNAD